VTRADAHHHARLPPGGVQGWRACPHAQPGCPTRGAPPASARQLHLHTPTTYPHASRLSEVGKSKLSLPARRRPSHSSDGYRSSMTGEAGSACPLSTRPSPRSVVPSARAVSCSRLEVSTTPAARGASPSGPRTRPPRCPCESPSHSHMPVQYVQLHRAPARDSRRSHAPPPVGSHRSTRSRPRRALSKAVCISDQGRTVPHA